MNAKIRHRRRRRRLRSLDVAETRMKNARSCYQQAKGASSRSRAYVKLELAIALRGAAIESLRAK